MTLTPLEQLLSSLEILDRSPEQKQFQTLLSCWSEVIGPQADSTRPLSLRKGILKVATATPALSQELTFKAPRILEDLNRFLSIPLSQIRFSAALWHSRQKPDFLTGDTLEHPSQLPTKIESVVPSPTKDPQVAFQQWAASIKERSRHLPNCPQCHSPTPPGELQRWSVCALCATKQFS